MACTTNNSIYFGGIKAFWSKDIETFCPKKLYLKKSIKFV